MKKSIRNNYIVLFIIGAFTAIIFSCGGGQKVIKKDEAVFAGSKILFLKENIRSNPGSAENHYQLAQAYFELDSLNAALSEANKSLEIDSSFNQAKLLRGNIRLKTGQLKDSYIDYLSILLSTEGENYVQKIRAKFGEPYPIHQLTRGEFNNAFPYFSPDDKRIAFQSDRDGNWEIYLMDADGTQEVRLTNNNDQDEMPVFSDAENIIAFTSTRDDTGKKSRMNMKRNIFLMDLNEGNVAREIDHEADDWYPALFDDGKEMAYVSERDDQRDVPFQERYSDLYYRNVRKSQTLRLTQNEADDGSPSFSSDGKWILFTSNRDGLFQIYKIDKKGQMLQQLTSDIGNCGSPHWSHDSKKITFFSDVNGNHDIFTMDATGGNIVRLTKSQAQDSYPSYSSDKRKIVFHSNRSGKYQIYWIDLMNPLGLDELIDELEEEINSL